MHAFYPVVPDAARVRMMLDAGARWVQLRAKGDEMEVVRRDIAEALRACRARGATLVVNDHWTLAIDLGASWVHLGQEDLDTADVPALRAHGVALGISTHDDAELDRALDTQPDYIALGPIWPTTLKVMPWAPQGLPRLGTWKRRIGDLPLVAIGGITRDRARACLHAGADSVAVVSDVVNDPDPVRRAHQWLAVLA